jgi:hypothetical protein
VERMDPWFAAKIVGVFTLKTEAKRKMRLEEFFFVFFVPSLEVPLSALAMPRGQPLALL